MAGPSGKAPPFVQPKLRLDKWLFHARFFRSRDLASDMIEAGHLRINAQRCSKPGHGVGIGDVLTFPQGNRIRVIRVVALSDRRGPFPQAQVLFIDLAPPSGPPPLESPDQPS